MDDIATFLAAKLGIETKWAWFICGAMAMFIFRLLFHRRRTLSNSSSDPNRFTQSGNSNQKKFVTQTSSSTTHVNIDSQKFDLDQQTLSKVRVLIKANDKIQAIKLIREKTGLGLAEAKGVMEALEKSFS